MIAWTAMAYLSVGLAFFAWLLAYRLERYDIRSICDRIGIPYGQRWLIFVLWALIYSVFWPAAIPLTLKQKRS